jgi:hypothetical protein
MPPAVASLASDYVINGGKRKFGTKPRGISGFCSALEAVNIKKEVKYDVNMNLSSNIGQTPR